MTTNPDDRAYPIFEKLSEGRLITQYGLTKREVFASQILCGLLANPNSSVRNHPEEAVKLADILIKELNKQ